ncbi:MAG: hypothetical protein HN742_34715 [Lentisphaerae bacterium]|jgi:hypothetical protein|nr:hypothetical protein [Lentisphaerota bacterium]MBT4816348.1 hypothetical protein [Lentisphaerota bacterium]MBT5609879.1 hypothetical protein [Lentisphaerota bacterium]MBT7056925.1 hypothetical protein [Lentisphaerota bacterium]MBT7847075.1 hypothetical protein [Lentisphaerota bacterium]
MKRLIYAILLASGFGAPLLRAQEPAKPFSPGLEVGKPIPALEVVDQTGEKRTFAELCGTKGALFVFYRSAAW